MGCVFTQTGLDEQKRPVRDEASTTYVGAIERAKAFGWRIYTEAVRRRLPRAEQVIVLGDGAPWIGGIAEEHFPSAVQIVDLYHAREHLASVSKMVYGQGTVAAKRWAAARCQELDAGRVEAVVTALKKLHPRGPEAQHEVRKAIAYFQTNAHRMRYAEFRRRGFFVGSGVVEAGCKTLIGLRLKQSGMQWTVRGGQRYHRTPLLRTQWSLGRILGESCGQPVSATHKFVAHPPAVRRAGCVLKSIPVQRTNQDVGIHRDPSVGGSCARTGNESPRRETALAVAVRFPTKQR